MRLEHKETVLSSQGTPRVKRVFDRARPPFDRLGESNAICDANRSHLEALRDQTDPLQLRQEIYDLLDDLSSGSGVTHFFVGMGSVGAPTVRRRLFDAGVRHGLIPITTVHPRATVAESATLGEGSAIMAGAVIGVRAIIGDNAIVNTGALVDHDCRVGCHAHVSTGAQLAGGVTIGDGAHVSIGATVIQGVAVGEGAIVGAGAVVLRPVSPHVTVVGVPAHTLDRRDAT